MRKTLFVGNFLIQNNRLNVHLKTKNLDFVKNTGKIASNRVKKVTKYFNKSSNIRGYSFSYADFSCRK